MRILNSIPGDTPIAVAVGSFDGLHLGHRALLGNLQQEAHRLGCQAVAVTFQPHPLAVLHPEQPTQLLTTREERAGILGEMGLDALVELPFTHSLAQMPPEDFVRLLSPNGNLRHAAVGFNFRFGAGARGDGDLLAALGRENGFTTCLLPPFMVDGGVVSSTAIRRCAAHGDMEEVTRLLGRAFGYMGVSRKGKQLGRTLGFPTVNLWEEPEKVRVPSGVYASVLVHHGIHYPAMTNVGRNPTVEQVDTRRIETHVLMDTPHVAYGSRVEVLLLGYTRGEIAFSSVRDLQAQLEQDKQRIRAYHKL